MSINHQGGIMKWCKFAIVLSFFSFGSLASAQSADTLDIVGPYAGSWLFGWNGESYKGTAWCGDTTYKDLTPDTTFFPDTQYQFVFVQVIDTVIGVSDTQYNTRDTLISEMLITQKPLINDSTKVDSCSRSDFVADTGGFTPGAEYVNYYYKFRNYYAQVPIIWAGWAGWDSVLVAPYKTLMVVYKGLLPTHQMAIEFSYATWRFPVDSAAQANDSIKNKTGAGDGVGILPASPNEWKTAVVEIPDSVNMVRITGIIFSIGNAPNQGGPTSDLGNLKIARISLLPSPSAVRRTVPRTGQAAGRFSFIPKSAGKVTLSIYSLRGELLCNKTFGVEANKRYSMRQMVQAYSGRGGAQMKLVKIRGAGVNMNEKIW
jgi:hypothetical protein